ncbi:homing endonuclease [Pseudomonas phage PspYZU05]|uniref:Homing endonuclease n=1 Tax=Pseudomonas phage PspYZU05 TaxID=1983556 RepID=A0A2U7NF17_9CAUD|nr:homing endonuclease [Pseudomonas phage PspYZU05]ASD52021.1 homing endonuclease [Pseudomonas phage PspYZU05]
MDVVYKLTFINRIKEGTLPYYYIGSVSNITLIDGKMIKKNGKEYLGSSKWKGYKKIVDSSDIQVELLYTGEDILIKERDIQIELDVVSNPEYFNLSIATINNYTDSDYATYKHSSGKCVRLHRNDPRVLSGEYVGITKGLKSSEETKAKISKSVTLEKNGFYGRRHTEETKQKLAIAAKGRKVSDEAKDKMSESRKGVKKTEEHKAKIGRKGLVMLKHIDGRCVRVHKSESQEYYSQGFVNPLTLKAKAGALNKGTCPHCNKTCDTSNLKRWHLDRCKHAKDQ